MSEQAEATIAKKTKPEVRSVSMEDGKIEEFVGKRRLNKQYIIDSTKAHYDTNHHTLTLHPGVVKIRLGFENGSVRLFDLPLGDVANGAGDVLGSGLLVFAGHGAEQKFGDNLAAKADEPLSADDMVEATDALAAEIAAGRWGKARAEGGGAVSGAHIVLKAIAEVHGKPVEEVKAFAAKYLESHKDISRKAFYDTWSDPATAVGKVVARMKDEERAKKTNGLKQEDVAAELFA